jgi:tetratricopeptide (TPR) repeat protein
MGRFREAEAQLAMALQANPANAQILVVACTVLASSGHPERAAELAEKVLRLDPWMTSENLNAIKDAYVFARRFEDAIAMIERILNEARVRF